MASGPITSWQIDGETMEKVADFIFGGGGKQGPGRKQRARDPGIPVLGGMAPHRAGHNVLDLG